MGYNVQGFKRTKPTNSSSFLIYYNKSLNNFIKNSKTPSPIFSHTIVGKQVLKNIKKNEPLDLKKIMIGKLL